MQKIFFCSYHNILFFPTYFIYARQKNTSTISVLRILMRLKQRAKLHSLTSRSHVLHYLYFRSGNQNTFKYDFRCAGLQTTQMKFKNKWYHVSCCYIRHRKLPLPKLMETFHRVLRFDFLRICYISGIILLGHCQGSKQKNVMNKCIDVVTNFECGKQKLKVIIIIEIRNVWGRDLVYFKQRLCHYLYISECSIF